MAKDAGCTPTLSYSVDEFSVMELSSATLGLERCFFRADSDMLTVAALVAHVGVDHDPRRVTPLPLLARCLPEVLIDRY